RMSARIQKFRPPGTRRNGDESSSSLSLSGMPSTRQPGGLGFWSSFLRRELTIHACWQTDAPTNRWMWRDFPRLVPPSRNFYSPIRGQPCRVVDALGDGTSDYDRRGRSSILQASGV